MNSSVPFFFSFSLHSLPSSILLSPLPLRRGHESFLQTLEGVTGLGCSIDVHQELADLEAKENQIDAMLLEAQQRVRSMEQDDENKWVLSTEQPVIDALFFLLRVNVLD